MVRFLISGLLTGFLAFAFGLFMPWWSIAPASFIAAIIVHQSPVRSFLAGFFALFILWGSLAWWMDIKNHGILSKKIAMILPLNGNTFLLILVTAFVGALVGAVAALTGSLLQTAVKQTK